MAVRSASNLLTEEQNPASRDIDAKTEISLVGYGLLGLALAYRGREDFSTLLRRRVLAPLEMRETRLAGDGPLDSAVGLRSTVREILKFLSAMLGTPVRSSLPRSSSYSGRVTQGVASVGLAG